MTDPTPAHCPACGQTRTLTRSDVCAPCAAAHGFDPPCRACHTEAAGRSSHGLTHVSTCAPGRRDLVGAHALGQAVIDAARAWYANAAFPETYDVALCDAVEAYESSYLETVAPRPRRTLDPRASSANLPHSPTGAPTRPDPPRGTHQPPTAAHGHGRAVKPPPGAEALDEHEHPDHRGCG
jgi:hypothetical protein